MSKSRLTGSLMLACITALAACTSDGGSPSGNTELNVVIPNNAPGLGGGSSAPGEVDIQSVEYTINCLGNDATQTDGFLDNGTLQNFIVVNYWTER